MHRSELSQLNLFWYRPLPLVFQPRGVGCERHALRGQRLHEPERGLWDPGADPSKIVFIKELGLGAALTVLIDASVIRALLVPSLMELLGPLNWWAPRPLRRLHDRIGLSEGAAQPA